MSAATFTTSVEDRYFEDYVAGAVHEFDGITVEEAEVIAFGQRFDPQPFHTNPEAAKSSAFRRVDCQRLAYSEPYDAAFCSPLPLARGKSGLTRR